MESPSSRKGNIQISNYDSKEGQVWSGCVMDTRAQYERIFHGLRRDTGAGGIPTIGGLWVSAPALNYPLSITPMAIEWLYVKAW